MEGDIKEKLDRKVSLMKKIGILEADIEVLENNLVNDDGKFQNYVFALEPMSFVNGHESLLREKYHPAKLSKLLESVSRASGFKLENFTRKLRLSPGGLYTYDCLLEGRTSSLKFIVKFEESVQGPGCECGEISSMESEVIMSRGDPESLSDWISECCGAGDLAMLLQGVVEFTELSNNRRSTLRSLYRRGKAGQLGSCSFSIVGEEDGVKIVGVGPKNVNVFTICWKIVFFHSTKSMKSTFDVTLHEEDLQYESAEVFAALQRPYISEEDLPLLWDAVADTLISCS